MVIYRYNYRLITQMHWSSSFSISHLNKCATIIQRNWRGFLGRDLTRVLVRVGTDFYKLNFYKSTLSSQCMLSINILTNTIMYNTCMYIYTVYRKIFNLQAYICHFHLGEFYTGNFFFFMFFNRSSTFLWEFN